MKKVRGRTAPNQDPERPKSVVATHLESTGISSRLGDFINREAEDPDNSASDGSDGSDGFDGSLVSPEGGVLDAVREHLSRYLLPASDHDLDLLSLWAVHTHLAVESYTTPRLIITSPLPSSGKTTVLEHLERLVPNPVQMSTVSSPALIPRILAESSSVLLIDETEKSLSPNKPGIADVLAVLNSGYKVGAKRPVLIPTKDSGWKVSSLPTFAPVAMAGNAPDLPEDTMQRAIVVTMFPATEDEVEDSDWELIEADVQALGARVAAWADTIREEVRSTRPPVPLGCIGRAKERWLPLMRVAVFAGGIWPEVVEQMIVDNLDQIAQDRAEGLSTMPIHIHLLRDLHDLFATEEADFIATEDILSMLKAQHPERWDVSMLSGRALTPQRMGQMLVKHFQIRSGKNSKDKRGYHRVAFTRGWRAMGVKDSSERRPYKSFRNPSSPS